MLNILKKIIPQENTMFYEFLLDCIQNKLILLKMLQMRENIISINIFVELLYNFLHRFLKMKQIVIVRQIKDNTSKIQALKYLISFLILQITVKIKKIT